MRFLQTKVFVIIFIFKQDDLTLKIVQNRADEENLEEHRFDANNVHSRLNLTMDNVANEIDVDLDMDGDHPSKLCFRLDLYMLS